MRRVDIIHSKRIWIAIFCISFLLYVLYVTIFEPILDDAFLGEQLYWLLVDEVRSDLMSGFRDIGIEELWTVFHKGIIYYGYFWSKLFGWSIYTLHVGSIILSLVFIVLLWKYFRDAENRFTPNAFFIVASVCFLFYYFTWGSSRFRPEILELVLAFITYNQLSFYLKRKKSIHIILGAMVAGLAMLAHLNGMIIIAAGCMVLVFNRTWWKAFLFGSIACIVFLVTYFMDVFLLADFQYFLNQFQNDPALNASHFHWYSPFLKIHKEYIRYFHADVNMVLSIPFFTVFIISFRYLWRTSRNMMIFMLTMMIVISFYTYNKKAIFMLPYFPFMAILMVKGAVHIIGKNKPKLIHKVAIFLFLIYFPAAAALLIIKITDTSKYSLKQTEEIGNIIGKDNRVLADEFFIFHEIKKQSYIVNTDQFRFFRSFHGYKAYNFDEYLTEAMKRKIDFFIIRFDLLDMFEENIIPDDHRYDIVVKNPEYAILKIK